MHGETLIHLCPIFRLPLVLLQICLNFLHFCIFSNTFYIIFFLGKSYLFRSQELPFSHWAFSMIFGVSFLPLFSPYFALIMRTSASTRATQTHNDLVDFVISTLFETRLISTFWNTNIAYSIRNIWTTEYCNNLFSFMERGKEWIFRYFTVDCKGTDDLEWIIFAYARKMRGPRQE